MTSDSSCRRQPAFTVRWHDRCESWLTSKQTLTASLSAFGACEPCCFAVTSSNIASNALGHALRAPSAALASCGVGLSRRIGSPATANTATGDVASALYRACAFCRALLRGVSSQGTARLLTLASKRHAIVVVVVIVHQDLVVTERRLLGGLCCTCSDRLSSLVGTQCSLVDMIRESAG